MAPPLTADASYDLRAVGTEAEPAQGSREPAGSGPYGQHHAGARTLAATAGILAAAIPAAALCGWMFNIDPLKRWLPGQVAMNPATACGLLMLACGVLVMQGRERARSWVILARCAAAVVLIFSGVYLAALFAGGDAGIGRVLFSAKVAQEPQTVGLRAALAFIAASSALLLFHAHKRSLLRPCELLGGITAATALLSLLDYAYGRLNDVFPLYAVPMAFPTATAFLLLAAAILLGRVDVGAMRVVFSDTAGGVVARRLLPLAVLGPVVLGALRLLGEAAGLYSTITGIALMASAFVVIFLAAIIWTAWMLYRVDIQRASAEAARSESAARLQQLNTELEQRVAERTAELELTNRQLEESGRLARGTLDALSAHIAILDEHGVIVKTNDAWRRFAVGNRGALTRTAEGANYLAVCDQTAGENARFAHEFAAGIRTVIDGTQASFAMEYPCHSPAQQRWFVGRVTPFPGPGPKTVAVAHEDVTARKVAEESLRFQAHLLKNSGEAAIATDIKGTIIYMNDAAESLYGWPASEAIGRSIMEVTVPEISRAEGGEIFDRMCKGESWRGEFVVHRRDGTTFPVSVTNTPLRDEHGRVTAIVGLSKDISERQQAEAALRDSEQRFRQLAENIQDVFWMVDVDYAQNIYVSPAYEEIWGRSRESLKQNPLSFGEAVVPEDRAAFAAYLENEAEAPSTVEYRIRRPDGTIRWIHDRAFPVPDEQGRIYRLAGIARDITARKESERALSESEQRFREIAENIDDVFWIVDLAEHGLSPVARPSLYVSPAFESVWGITREQLRQNPQLTVDAVHPEDREVFVATIAQQTQRPTELEYRIVRADRQVRWIRHRSFPVLGENGEPVRVAGVASDITAKKEAQLALQQSAAELRALARRLNAAREEASARIARELHDELGQAMTAMKMDLAVAQRQLAKEDEAAHDETLRRLARMRSGLDETISATRRICTELRPALLDQFGLIPAIEWLVSEFDERSEIFCNLNVCDCDPPITGEPATAIFRIVQELLTNIARHAGASEVSIELACSDSDVELTVEDNGRGIDVAAAQTSRGLGLIGIRERALAVGGRVTISGEANHGTQVVLTVPRQDEVHGERES